MTIREYIKIHSDDSFINTCSVVIEPFSLYGKNHNDKQKQLSVIFQQQKKINIRPIDHLKFYNLENLAKKLDFSIKIEKVKVHYDSCYSHDAEPETVFYIDDKEFLKLTKSCMKNELYD